MAHVTAGPQLQWTDFRVEETHWLTGPVPELPWDVGPLMLEARWLLQL